MSKTMPPQSVAAYGNLPEENILRDLRESVKFILSEGETNEQRGLPDLHLESRQQNSTATKQ